MCVCLSGCQFVSVSVYTCVQPCILAGLIRNLIKEGHFKLMADKGEGLVQLSHMEAESGI